MHTGNTVGCKDITFAIYSQLAASKNTLQINIAAGGGRLWLCSFKADNCIHAKPPRSTLLIVLYVDPFYSSFVFADVMIAERWNWALLFADF